MNFKHILYTMAILLGITISVEQSNADSTRLSIARPRTAIYLYNRTNYPLSSIFHAKATDGGSVANWAHYPNEGHVIIAEPFNKNKQLPAIAELARNKGINTGRTYIFSQTVDLPGLGPVLTFKQKLLGVRASSKIEMGIEASEVGIKEMFFSDNAWHRIVIPVDNQVVGIQGVYAVDFCFYTPTLGLSKEFYLEGIGGSARETAVMAASGSIAGAGSVIGLAIGMWGAVSPPLGLLGGIIAGGSLLAAAIPYTPLGYSDIIYMVSFGTTEDMQKETEKKELEEKNKKSFSQTLAERSANIMRGIESMHPASNISKAREASAKREALARKEASERIEKEREQLKLEREEFAKEKEQLKKYNESENVDEFDAPEEEGR